jgi:O-methyltransferase involved in polyketide biosynthesis
VDNGSVEWYDLDLPDVIELRRRFFSETERCHMIASSVTDFDWMKKVSTQGRAVLVIAEGLLMYLKEADVKALLLKLQAEYPGSAFVFDAYSTQVVQRITAHPSIRSTGATIHWGIDDPKEIESWGKGIRLKEEWYFTQSREIEKLAFGYRLIFKLSGLFQAARKAHRILYYNV